MQLASNPNRPTAVRSGKFAKALRNDWQLYLLMVLPLIYFLLFKYVPMAGVVVAFKEYNIFKASGAANGSVWKLSRKCFGQVASGSRSAIRSC